MKRIILIVLSMLLVVCIMPTYGGKSAPEPQCVKRLASQYFEILFDNRTVPVDIINVPTGEVFILTDIAFTRTSNSSTQGFVDLFEGETIKCSFLLEHLHESGSSEGSSPMLNFDSGISFASDSIVALKTNGTWGKYFFSGYFTNCF